MLRTGIILRFVEDETAFTKSHAKKALKLLEYDDGITVDPFKTDGSKRRKGTFPDKVVVHF